MRTRIHGDYHLGQVLYTGSDFFIIDFEGEPARPLAERRVKQSPLQDVAGMLRSFHYAAFAPLLTPPKGTSISSARIIRMSRWAEAWSRCAANRFLTQYYETSGAARYIPADSRARARLLEMYLLAKAVYELGYELNNRPAWVGIPLEGISSLLSS
jgi:maltose alpha-D-glucosyltransferase/alpha-amylase